MLALQGLDTNGCLERFARHPNNRTSALGLMYLKLYAVTQIRWDIATHMPSKDTPYDLMQSLRMGTRYEKPHVVTIDDIVAMSDDDKAAYYDKCCKLAGFELDSEDSLDS